MVSGSQHDPIDKEHIHKVMKKIADLPLGSKLQLCGYLCIL